MIWSKKEKELLKKLYPNTFSRDLVKIFKRNSASIRQKARILGIKSNLQSLARTKKYSCNEKFFKSITIENSYYAGFIAADGCIVTTTKNNKALQIDIQQKDSYILKNLKRDIEYTGPIINKKRYRYNVKVENSSVLKISSIDICQDLEQNFNIKSRKSLTLKPPKNLSLKQSLAYIIGYIDGDGSIFYSTYKRKYGSKRYQLSIVGTKEILNWINSIFSQKYKVNKKVYKRDKIYQYALGRMDSEKVLKSLKKIKIKKLERKWSKVI